MTRQSHDPFVFPDDSRWNDARQAWNLAADLRPAVVALPSSVEDVVAAVNYAVERDLRDRRPGHGSRRPGRTARSTAPSCSTCARCAASRSTPRSRRARVEAGALWEEVVGPADRARPHGVARLVPERRRRRLLARRRHRLDRAQARPLGRERARRRDRHGGRRARARRPDAEHRPLLGPARRRRRPRRRRRVEIALYPVDELVAGMMIWPWERSAGGAHALRRVGGDRTEVVSASARMLQIPPLPDIPEELRGRQIVVIDGAVLGTEAEANEILAAVPRARARDRHVRDRPGRVADPAAHGSRAADARHRRRRHGRRPRRRRDRRDGRRRPALAPTRRSSSSSSGSSAARSASEGPARARSALSTARSRSSRLGVPMGPEVGGGDRGRIDALKQALAPWSRGKPYLNFAEQAGRDRRRGRRRGLRPARGDQGVGRSRRSVSAPRTGSRRRRRRRGGRDRRLGSPR